MAIAIAVILVLVFAGIMVFVTTSSSSRSKTGILSRETRSRDKAAHTEQSAVAIDETSGRARSDETRAGSATPAVADKGTVAKAEPVPDEEEIGISRRQFFNRGIVGATALGLASFGAGAIAFIWPSSSGGFGGLVNTGTSIDDILAEVANTRTPGYFSEARAYVNPYPAEDIDKAIAAGYPDAVIPALENGYIVQYQKCPHLGCRVPWCESSQWFECPCHGSKYNRVGEKRDGPAPRGMTLWRSEISADGILTIDTSTEYPGLPIGTNTTDQKPEGPACV